MTRLEIAQRVGEVATARYDPERAHIIEDRLLVDVLKDIAKTGDALARSKAAAALRVRRIDFPRWAA